jgi:autotransporter translocation and assembly factor TamB
MTVRWDPAWTATSSGDANVVVRSSGLSLAVLNAFTGRTVRDVSGELAVDITATGPISSLRPKGVAELRDGGFVIPAYGSSLQGASVVVRFDEREARVERLFARGPEGTLEGRGLVPLASGDAPIQLTLEAKQFRAASSYRYRADIEGTITVGGTPSAPVVGGRIAVLEAALRPDISFLGKAPKPRDPTIRLVSANEPQAAAPPPEPAAAKPSVYEAASIDVVVAIGRNTWIRHEEAALELEGEVHATKRCTAGRRCRGVGSRSRAAGSRSPAARRSIPRSTSSRTTRRASISCTRSSAARRTRPRSRSRASLSSTRRTSCPCCSSASRRAS